MFKLMTVGLALCALTLAAPAAEGDKPERKRPELTEEQKKQRSEIVAKYDTNKDGRLNAEERKAMSAEDREKLAQLSGRGQRGKKAEDK